MTTTANIMTPTGYFIDTLRDFCAADDFTTMPIQTRIAVRRTGCAILTAEIEAKDAFAGRNDGGMHGLPRRICRARARNAIRTLRALCVTADGLLH